MTVPACFIFYLKYSLLSKTAVWLGNKAEPYNNKLLNNPDSHFKCFTLSYYIYLLLN